MGFFLQNAWLIPLFPLLGFAIITLLPFIRANKSLSGWIAIGLMIAATVVALGVGWEVASGVHVAPDGTVEVVSTEEHAAEGESFTFPPANIVQTFRWAIVGSEPPGAMLIASIAITFVVLLLGAYYFRRTEEHFADFI